MWQAESLFDWSGVYNTRFGLNYLWLKNNTTLFALSDHVILCQEWRVIVGLNFKPIIMLGLMVWPSCWLRGILIVVACVLSQLKPSGFSILSCEKNIGLRPHIFFTTKNVELLVLYPIQNTHRQNWMIWLNEPLNVHKHIPVKLSLVGLTFLYPYKAEIFLYKPCKPEGFFNLKST